MARIDVVNAARTAFENLNERERKLVAILGGVLAVIVVGLPLWLLTSAIGDVHNENEEIRDVLREISRAGDELAEREAERLAAERRYQNPAPPLGSFLEAKAREAGYDRPLEVTDQPEKVTGEYTRRLTRASLPGVDLKTAVNMIAAIKNSPYPVAIEKLHIEHYQTGTDRYNVQLGVVAFDKEGAGGGGGGEGGGQRAGRGGPPMPP